MILGSKASVLSTAHRRMAIKVSKARSSNKITLGKILRKSGRQSSLKPMVAEIINWKDKHDFSLLAISS